jgi:hypothetical protein
LSRKRYKNCISAHAEGDAVVRTDEAVEIDDAIIQAGLAGDVEGERAPAAADDVVETRRLHDLEHGLPAGALVRDPYPGAQPADRVRVGGDPPQPEGVGHGAEAHLGEGGRDSQPARGVGVAGDGYGNECVDVAAASCPLGWIGAGGRG